MTEFIRRPASVFISAFSHREIVIEVFFSGKVSGGNASVQNRFADLRGAKKPTFMLDGDDKLAARGRRNAYCLIIQYST
ncbi:hypothetical protein Y032_0044g1066 [Ancylostoma ceylanicum]|uniref:Uncharacterized protein n=1 Tax=Ancylostoma ceylanicum TaxID=53326 RepID=A0A016UF61_9BILA|nr:hypothetical protein Y032_0044g1066 [Ancylostoma ceylanicum]